MMPFLVGSLAYACSSFRVVTEDDKVFFVFNFELGGTPGTKTVYYPAGSKFSASLDIEFHYTFHDPNGGSIVLEYIDGQPTIYDNQPGMTTNSPNFEWQRVNLNNYINLTALNAEEKQIADVKLVATGAGIGDARAARRLHTTFSFRAYRGFDPERQDFQEP